MNWKEQAVKKAKDYLKTMAFSKPGLIGQLEFEGFSNEEATYGAGTTWNSLRMMHDRFLEKL